MLLQQPGRIGDLRLKNRVLMAPMGTNFSTTDGLSTERDRAYYAERARGGVAMIMTEAMVVTPQARPHHNSLCCYHDRFIPGLASIVEAIQAHDCRVFGQLNHRGGLLRRLVLGMEPVGPSDGVNPNTGDRVRPLDAAEILTIQRQFVDAARRLWRAGYDGVEIHAANGYLFQQFFSPRINRRTDLYGGCLENRSRFLLETVARMKDALPGLCLMVRLCGSEFAEGGYGEPEIVALAQALEAAGVQAIDVSGGSNESPQLSKFCIQPPSFPRGCLAPTARPIRDAVGIPVFVAGRIVTPQDAEAVLQSGSADFVSLGRALYCDAHWALKAFGGMAEPIRECIACNVCFERLTLEKDVSCVQNPMVGTEFEALEHVAPALAHRGARRRVLVLGAGVAGLEAARVLAGRGHEVEIWEKAQEAGGQVPLALAAPDKDQVAPVWTWRLGEVRRLGVPLHVGVVASAQSIAAFAPDFVLLATGAVQRPPPMDVSGLDASVQVLHAWDALRQPERFAAGALVTIVGGGMVGAELADLLRLRGVQLRIVELLPGIAGGMARNNRLELVERLAPAADIRTSCRIVALRGHAIVLQQGEQPAEELPIGQALVFATGPRPDTSAIDAVEASGIPFERIGDCSTPGDFLAAVRDGWMAALAIDGARLPPAARAVAAPSEQVAA